VLFSPEDIDLITGAPALRRKYLNMLLFQADRKYKKGTGDYLKAVIRRNKLLEKIRETGRGHDELPFWNDKILSTGEYIQQKRQEVLSYLDSFLKRDSTSEIRKGKGFGIKYVMNEISTKRLLEYKDKEILAGKTLIGPHRDDLEFLMDEAPMAQFSSRGEQRTAVFLIKQAECSYIKAQSEAEPVLLLDDIFSELDREHREAIISFISGRQTFITAAIEREFTDLYINKTIRLPIE
jgi:DNA replication and repair protein RecF